MSTNQTVYRADYQPPAWSVDSIDLEVDIGDEEVVVRALSVLRRVVAEDRSPLVLDGEALDTRLVAVDGRPLGPDEYELGNGTLTIPGLGAEVRLETVVHLRPYANTELSGLYGSGAILCTQCEAQGFRRITWFFDRPDVLTRYRVAISAERQRYPVLLSNGNRLAEEDLGGGRHRVRWEDPFPKPSYLFALVAGKLDCLEGDFTTVSGRSVRLELWVDPGRRERARHALASLQQAMRWDEERYGREYDLDLYMIVAVADFNMGAMENKGLNIFNARYVLADDDSATDADYEAIEGVIGHEYFHNWTGNRITCRDWFQLTLKEGLTVFRDQQFSADRNSAAVKRIDEVRILRQHQFLEDAGPMAHPIRPESYQAIDNFYTTTVYNKGAEVIRMYHTLLGEQGFRAGMDLYFARHDGQAVTCDDFRAAMADANGRDLERFARWYSQPGTPELVAEGRFDAATGCFHLRLRQQRRDLSGFPAAEPFHIPVRMGLLDAQGRPLPLRLAPDQAEAPLELVLELVEVEQEWVFHGLAAAPVASLLRDFSAPVRLHQTADDAALTLRAAHDPDPFNRWQAGQEVARRVLLEQIRSGTAPAASPALDAIFAATLAAEDLDDALKALALDLPGISELGQELERIDIEAIHRVRDWHARHLAAGHAPALRAAYEQRRSINAVDRSIAARQGRRLAHACLAHLVRLGTAEIDLIANHYRSAASMTQRIAALAALANLDHPEAVAALADFHQRHGQDALVLDKWFTVQAVADRPDAVERVEALRHHPDFTLANPNRIRSLIGAFASGNPVHFHRADGRGYALVGAVVRELSRVNPQVAARLACAFNHWRRYDDRRQGLMQAQLEAIRDADPSRDVAEIVERALAGR